MTFLQLVQRLRRKCRVSGTGPTTVVGQNEEYARLVDWINEAWMEIQLERPDWDWMRASMTFPTVNTQASYTLADIQSTGSGFSNFGNWDLRTFRQYVTSVGTSSEIEIGYIPYDVWRDLYQFSASRLTYSAPVQFTIMPNLGIGLGPVPIDGYTVIGDYYKVATELVLDADTPLLPSQFHMAIVYRAMKFYGVSEAAPEVYDEGDMEGRKMMRRVEGQQLPAMDFAGALA